MADEQEPKKKSKLKWIILLFILLLLGGGGFVAWKFFLQDMLMPKETDPNAPKQEVVAQEKNTGLRGTIVALPVFRVNLADPLGKRFIKLMVEVEAASPDAATELQNYQAPIRDAIILLLSSKSYADLASMESKMLLKGEITDRLNQILGGPKVLQVFFTDMVIQ